MRNIDCIALSAVDTSSQNGSPIDANQLVSASFQAVFGDTGANGTVKIQASNDIANNRYEGLVAPTHWVDIPNASASVTSGASVVITIAQMAYRWVRVVYTRTSGGSSTVVVNMNAIGI